MDFELASGFWICRWILTILFFKIPRLKSALEKIHRQAQNPPDFIKNPPMCLPSKIHPSVLLWSQIGFCTIIKCYYFKVLLLRLIWLTKTTLPIYTQVEASVINIRADLFSYYWLCTCLGIKQGHHLDTQGIRMVEWKEEPHQDAKRQNSHACSTAGILFTAGTRGLFESRGDYVLRPNLFQLQPKISFFQL